jgi:hypothetical protein
MDDGFKKRRTFVARSRMEVTIGGGSGIKGGRVQC